MIVQKKKLAKIMAETVDKGVRTCYNIVAYKSLFINFAGGG